MSILVVEDEALIRLMVVEELAFEGYAYAEAASGEEAIDLIENGGPEQFSALVTDFHMPGGVDGCEVAERFRERFPKAPVIIVTGRPDALGTRYRSICDLMLKKPFTPSQLLVALGRALGRRETSGNNPAPLAAH